MFLHYFLYLHKYYYKDLEFKSKVLLINNGALCVDFMPEYCHNLIQSILMVEAAAVKFHSSALVIGSESEKLELIAYSNISFE